MAIREKTQLIQYLSKYKPSVSMISRALIVFVVASFIAYLRPFGMDEMSFIRSWAFWLVLCFVGWGIFEPTLRGGGHLINNRLDLSWPALLLHALLLLVASCLMALIVPLITELFFKLGRSYSEQVINALLPSVCVGGFIGFWAMLKGRLDQQKVELVAQSQYLKDKLENSQQAQDDIADRLLAKLPIEKRGKLRYLQIDDHYLRINTDRGEYLLLMRLKDAITLLDGYDGMQCHRSWWVAKDAIVGKKKQGRILLLLLDSGVEVPVSVTYMDAVKAWL